MYHVYLFVTGDPHSTSSASWGPHPHIYATLLIVLCCNIYVENKVEVEEEVEVHAPFCVVSFISKCSVLPFFAQQTHWNHYLQIVARSYRQRTCRIMPVTPEELVRLLALLATEENLKVTVKETLKGGAMAGAGAVIGGMVGGPVGIALGKKTA